MTEAEWLACTDPTEMLAFLGDRPSRRKQRLFAVAACRERWQWFTQEASRTAVKVAEQFADGAASRESLEAMQDAALQATIVARRGADGESGWYCAAEAARILTYPEADEVGAAYYAFAAGEATDADMATICQILRCIFGPVCFRSLTLGLPFGSWNDCSVSRFAESIYADRAFDRLPILADALEEAGCTNAAILEHCRGPGPHVRGCWVVDLLLGKS